MRTNHAEGATPQEQSGRDPPPRQGSTQAFRPARSRLAATGYLDRGPEIM